MKIDRLIGIVTILLQKEKVTIPELSARFEVSCRTIQRDIDSICQAGIPIVSIKGEGERTIEPPELREEIKKSAKNILSRYE